MSLSWGTSGVAKEYIKKATQQEEPENSLTQENIQNKDTDERQSTRSSDALNNSIENYHEETERNVRGRSRQAAAEEEHTVVRGSNKGRTITRKVVTNEHEGTMMKLEDDDNGIEHHQDPPTNDQQDDCMMIEDGVPWMDDMGTRGL